MTLIIQIYLFYVIDTVLFECLMLKMINDFVKCYHLNDFLKRKSHENREEGRSITEEAKLPRNFSFYGEVIDLKSVSSRVQKM